MEKIPLSKPRIFLAADVIFAGSASPNEHSASNIILRMGELGLIDSFTSIQVITEVERNLGDKLPNAMPAFQLLVHRSLKIVADPMPDDLRAYLGLADFADLPILVAAIREGCGFLTSFNLRHYQPGHPAVQVLKPGDLVLRVRYLLARLGDES